MHRGTSRLEAATGSCAVKLFSLHVQRWLAIGTIATLSACAGAPHKQAADTTPYCTNDSDCNQMWAAGRTFVLNHTGYRFQTYSPEFMRTLGPEPGDPRLAAQVAKESRPEGGYRIVAKFWCGQAKACVPDAQKQLEVFNGVLWATIR
jgi:hypothetical protein